MWQQKKGQKGCFGRGEGQGGEDEEPSLIFLVAQSSRHKYLELMNK